MFNIFRAGDLKKKIQKDGNRPNTDRKTDRRTGKKDRWKDQQKDRKE